MSSGIEALMKNVKKVKSPKMKLNLEHFDFKVVKMRMRKDREEQYKEMKAKAKPEEYELDYIKKYEELLPNPPSQLMVTHLPTKISKSWEETNYTEAQREAFAAEVVKHVNTQRAKKRQVETVKKVFDGAEYQVTAGVFSKGGSILDIGKFTTTNDPLKAKLPRSPKLNYIGVELEFNTLEGHSVKTIAKKLQDEGLARYVCVGTDGSCGFEVRVLIPDNGFDPILRKIMDTLKGMGFKTDHRCGAHVHLDMRNRNHELAYANLYQAQLLLRRLLPRGRRDNSYCRPNQYDTFKAQQSYGERFQGINVMAYQKYKTLEVRMHQGTLEADLLVPWINLLLKIVNKKEKVTEPIEKLKMAIPAFELDAATVLGLRKRIPSRTKSSVTSAVNI